MQDDIFRIVEIDAAQIKERYNRLTQQLALILPKEAEIHHIGATAIEGCLTKGDIDFCIRVPSPLFSLCESAMAAVFERNSGSIHNKFFASFVMPEEDAGFQLVVMGSPLDFFTRLRDLMQNNPALIQAYNELKKKFNGAPMTDYRAAKDAFIASVLSN